jgi:hypothetical protein
MNSQLYRVYDSRNNDTLFKSYNKEECIAFMDDIYEESSTDYIYTWLEVIA